MDAEPAPIWTPTAADVAQAQVTAFAAAARERGYAGSTYLDLWRWSIAHLDEFWAAVWEFFDVRAETPYEAVRLGSRMPGVRWFPGARLSYPEHVLRGRADDDVAIIDMREGADGAPIGREITAGELRARVAAFARTPSSVSSGCARATVSWATYPTSRRASSPCWGRRASAPSGRGVDRNTARPRRPRGSPSSSRWSL